MAVKEAWELHRDIARASGPQQLTAVAAEELDALTAAYDPLIDARGALGGGQAAPASAPGPSTEGSGSSEPAAADPAPRP